MRGCLVKRGKSGVWWAKIYRHGKQAWLRIGIMAKHDAEQILRAKIDEIERGFYGIPKRAFFEELAEKWQTIHCNDDLKKRTVDSYKERIRIHILPYFKNLLVSEITPQKVEEFKFELSRNLTARTVNYTLWVLHAILQKGKDWGYCYQNPVDSIDRLKGRRKESKALTKEEVLKLFDAAEGQGRTLLMMTAFSGMRMGEILAMKWSHLDWETGIYSVKESFDGDFDSPKTESSVRTIALPWPLIEELKAHKARQNHERLKAGGAYHDQGLIFASEVGTPIDRGNLRRRIFYPARDKAGIPKTFCFHQLRKTTATLSFEVDGNPAAVKNLMGHKSAKLTLEVYAKVNEVSKRALADKLGNYVLGPQSRATEGIS